jgi:ectoine hydroxylase-related dioxygenase (phytanoyl-CoA dioxygenase family)
VLTSCALAALDRDGFLIIPGVLGPAESRALTDAFEAAVAAETPGQARRAGSVYGLRNVLSDVPKARHVAASPAVRALVEPVLGRDCFAVRGILFDKTPDANWKVIWHQDMSIAVRARHDVPGWGPWSEKAGVPHVQPPACVLERMLAVRLHLDPCGPENGPLRVLPGTHTLGRLSPAEISRLRAERDGVICAVEQGGALLMRPLLLHASSAAQLPERRRVLHIEYAAADPLPGGLEWYERVAR